MLKTFGAFVATAILALGLAGCGVKLVPIEEDSAARPATSRAGAAARPLTGVPAPWTALAGRLVAKGFPEDRARKFFASPALVFTQKPMETKLRELFGIFYRSDLTKEAQESLYQLGYEILIDGRNGPGTKKAIMAFQKDHNLTQNGRLDLVLVKVLSHLVKKKRVRTLADYKPPAVTPPSRSATYPQFTKPSALAQIRNHYAQDQAIFDQMARLYGVPGALVASIMWIETGYGSFFGSNKAAASLASMAAAEDYSLVAPYVADLEVDPDAKAFLVENAKQRGEWALNELENLLVYAWVNNLDPLTFSGSIYGAIGYGQFMPSNVAKYSVDGDGDAKIDLFNKPDAIFSIGKFLRDHGWLTAKNEESRRQVIMRYNKSGTYVNTVLYVARFLDPNFAKD
ncbi:MAG: lytic murein transglycosylase [Deltaproteobacteria bacterium]|jgi:membrane-bound lytic murein transglycosylase B|nr:lytic murein transglycosylase [Deltaproteobacteria bacterium]